MMKSMLAAVVGVAGLAAASSAAWGLKFEVSKDNGATWQSSVQGAVGDVIKFRVGSYFDAGTQVTTADGTGQALLLNRFTGSNQWTNFSNGMDTISGLLRSLPSGNANLLALNGGSIGTTNATSFGSNLVLASLPDSPVFYSEIYTGNITIGDGSARTLVWGSKTFGVSPNTKGLTFYNAGSATNKLSGAPDGTATMITASVEIVPAPSAMALLGLGGLAVARRRRA